MRGESGQSLVGHLLCGDAVEVDDAGSELAECSVPGRAHRTCGCRRVLEMDVAEGLAVVTDDGDRVCNGLS